MALVVKDRVLETSTTTGTGDFTLAGAITGFRAFSSVCSTNDTFFYVIEAVDSNGLPTGDWETGYGTYSSANTLTRTTVKDSSNSGSAVNFSAGTKRVSINATAAYIGMSSVKVKKSANLTAQNLTGFNPVTFNTEEWDTDSYHNNASNTDRLTPPIPGYYMVIGYAEIANVTSANWARVVIGRHNSGAAYQEDVTVQETEISATGTYQLVASGVDFFNSGDFAKMFIQVESDTSTDITTNSYFAMIWIG